MLNPFNDIEEISLNSDFSDIELFDSYFSL